MRASPFGASLTPFKTGARNPSALKALTIIRSETLVRWHRAGFRRYWRWKLRSVGGRPQIAADLRALKAYARYYNDIRTHWRKMLRSLARYSGPESLIHTRSLADFITTTSGFRFSVHTAA